MSLLAGLAEGFAEGGKQHLKNQYLKTQQELLDLQVKVQKKALEKAAKKEEMEKTVSGRMAGTPAIPDPRALVGDEPTDPRTQGLGGIVADPQSSVGGMIADLEARGQALGTQPIDEFGSPTVQEGMIPTPYEAAGLPAGGQAAVAGKSLPEVMAELNVSEMADLGLDLKDALDIITKREGQDLIKQFLPKEAINKMNQGVQDAAVDTQGVTPIPTPPPMTIDDIFKQDKNEAPIGVLDSTFQNLTAFEASQDPNFQKALNEVQDEVNTPSADSGFIPTPTVNADGDLSLKLTPKSQEIKWIDEKINGEDFKVAYDMYGNRRTDKNPIPQSNTMTEYVPMSEYSNIVGLDENGDVVGNIPLNMKRGELKNNNYGLEFASISKDNKSRLIDLQGLRKRLDTIGDLSENIFDKSASIASSIKQKIFTNVDAFLRLNFEEGFNPETFNRIHGTDFTEAELDQLTVDRTVYASLQKDLSMLARTAGVQKGSLSDGDVGRAAAYLGKQKGQGLFGFFQGDSPEEASALFNDLMNYIDDQSEHLLGKTNIEYKRRTPRTWTGLGGRKEPEGGTSMDASGAF